MGSAGAGHVGVGGPGVFVEVYYNVHIGADTYYVYY